VVLAMNRNLGAHPVTSYKAFNYDQGKGSALLKLDRHHQPAGTALVRQHRQCPLSGRRPGSPPQLVDVVVVPTDVDDVLSALRVERVPHRPVAARMRGTGGGGQIVHVPTAAVPPQLENLFVIYDHVLGALGLNGYAVNEPPIEFGAPVVEVRSLRRQPVASDHSSCIWRSQGVTCARHWGQDVSKQGRYTRALSTPSAPGIWSASVQEASDTKFRDSCIWSVLKRGRKRPSARGS
jgi:hypothetical protein